MKKRRIVVPVSIVSILSLATTILFFLSKDDTPYPYDGFSHTNNEVLQSRLVNSFGNLSSKKKVEYELDKDQLNNLFYNSFHHLKDNGGTANNVNEFHIEINNNNYRFIFTSKVLFLKTRIVIDTTLEEKEDSYVFNINSIKNGSLPTKWLLDVTGTLNKIALEDIFKASGLSIEVNYANNQFIYRKKDFKNDFLSYLKKNSNDFFVNAINHSELIPNISDKLSYSIDLANLEENTDKSDSSPTSYHYQDYEIRKVAINDMVNTLEEDYRLGMDEEYITNWRNNVFPKTIKDAPYVNTGVNREIKDRIKKTNVSEYISGPYDKKVASIKESEIDSLLATTSIIGKNEIFRYKSKIVYALIDRFYSDFYVTSEGAFLTFTLGINLNGLETRAILESKCDYKNNSFVADFRIENIYYGKEIADKDFVAVVKNFIKEGLDSLYETDWIDFNPNKNSFVIDFDHLLANNEELEEYNIVFDKTVGRRYLKIEDHPVNDVGELSLYYQKY